MVHWTGSFFAMISGSGCRGISSGMSGLAVVGSGQPDVRGGGLVGGADGIAVA